MNQKRVILILVILISIVAVIAATAGIFSESGPGEYDYMSIRGKMVHIYGKGLYRDMSSDVAIQGIAQDYVTLFIAVPLLLSSLYFSRKGSLRWKFILAGTLNYFLVTYIMYLGIAMYNVMFLSYVLLIGTSFFALSIIFMSFDINTLPEHFTETVPIKFTGGFLIFNSIIISLLWIGVILPPLIDGTVTPDAVQHYTTLTVQGLDLAIFLPVSFIAGLLIIKRKPLGYLLATTTLIFLTILMTALSVKLIAMALNGVNVIPAICIIPAILLISILCASLLLKNIKS